LNEAMKSLKPLGLGMMSTVQALRAYRLQDE